jgi:hypothetical protein
VLVVPGVPGIDVGLAAGGQGEAVLGEPSEEGRGVLDLIASVPAACRSDRLLLRASAEPRQDFPGGEAVNDPGVVRVGGVGEVAGQPPLERADLLVDGGEDTAGHQEFPQVGGGSPGLEGVECLVGQFYLAAAEAPQQVLRRVGPPVAGIGPRQAGQRVVHGEQGVGQRDELGADPAGAVVQEHGEPVGESAAGA